MDEENKALNEQVGEQTSPDTTPVAEPEGEQTSEEVAEPNVATEGDTTETDGEGKKGAGTRIRELNTRAKVAEEKAQSLADKLAELTNPVGFQRQQPQYNPQEPITNADGTVDAETFRNRVLSEADARTELRIRQSEAVNRINNEAREVIGKYPQLDPDSEQFNPKLSKAITKATDAYVSKEPYSASVKKFVAELMEPYIEGVNQEVGQATENIAKQVSQAALRPTSVIKQEKTADSLSIAELERKLGVVNS